MQALSRSFFNDPNNGLFIQFMFHRTLSTTWRQLFAAYQFFKISQLDTLWMHTVSNLSANSCTAAIMPCAWGILVDGLLICPGYIPRNLSANFLHKLYESLKLGCYRKLSADLVQQQMRTTKTTMKMKLGMVTPRNLTSCAFSLSSPAPALPQSAFLQSMFMSNLLVISCVMCRYFRGQICIKWI